MNMNNQIQPKYEQPNTTKYNCNYNLLEGNEIFYNKKTVPEVHVSKFLEENYQH